MRPLCHEVPVDNLTKQAERCREKRRFDSKTEAKRMAKAAEKRFGIEFKTYLCTVCERFHLTKRK
jgi:hypothetical protein